MRKTKNTPLKYIYYGSIAALVVAMSLFVLEKSQVLDLYNKPVISPAETERPVNDVQYTPANPVDNETINNQKENGTITEQPPAPEPGQPINVVLTAAGQDNPGGPVVVRVLLTDVQNGSCSVTLSNDNLNKQYTSAVANAGTYYNCGNINIPIEDLEAGTWSLQVIVTSGNRTGTASESIEITI